MNMANVLFENSVSGNEKCHDLEGVSANTSNAPIEKKCLQKPHDVCYYAHCQFTILNPKKWA